MWGKDTVTARGQEGGRKRLSQPRTERRQLAVTTQQFLCQPLSFTAPWGTVPVPVLWGSSDDASGFTCQTANLGHITQEGSIKFVACRQLIVGSCFVHCDSVSFDIVFFRPFTFEVIIDIVE